MTTLSQHHSIEERLDAEYAPAWRPNPGDRLVGIVTDLARLDSTFDGRPYPCVTIRDEAGTEFAFHAFHAVAKRELGKVRPRVGDRLGIRYGGLKETQDGRNVHVYKIVSDSAVAEFTWDEFPAEASEEPDPTSETDDDVIPF